MASNLPRELLEMVEYDIEFDNFRFWAGPTASAHGEYIYIYIYLYMCIYLANGSVRIFYTVWGKILPLNKMLTLLDFGSLLKNPKICRQIIGMSRRKIFHAPQSSQMPYMAKISKSNVFTNNIKNPLELRLDRHVPKTYLLTS